MLSWTPLFLSPFIGCLSWRRLIPLCPPPKKESSTLPTGWLIMTRPVVTWHKLVSILRRRKPGSSGFDLQVHTESSFAACYNATNWPWFLIYTFLVTCIQLSILCTVHPLFLIISAPRSWSYIYSKSYSFLYKNTSMIALGNDEVNLSSNIHSKWINDN